MKTAILTILCACLALPAWAGTFSIDLNNDSTQLQYIQKMNTQNYGDSLAKVRYFYDDDTDTNLLGVAAGVTGSPGNADGLKFGFDLGVNATDSDNDLNVVAVGVGANISFNPPGLPGLGLDGHVVYSPEIFTFADGEEYTEWGVGVSYQVLPNASVTLAYQNIEIDFEGLGKGEIDDAVRVGLRLDF